MTRIEVPIERLPIGRAVRLKQGDAAIVAVRRPDGEIYAFHDYCPHAGWRLSDGEVVGCAIECPGHGMQFDLATGRCLDVDSHRLEPVYVTRLGARVHFLVPTDPPLKRGAA